MDETTAATADREALLRRRNRRLGLGFLWHAWRVWREPQDEFGRRLAGDAAAKKAVRYSLLYLAALFAAPPLDRLIPA